MLEPVIVHPFDVSEAEAAELQSELAEKVIAEDQLPPEIRLVAGVDVAYDTQTGRLFSAVVVLDSADLRPVETAVGEGQSGFDYVPGLFSFREIPALMLALNKVKSVPDLVICDGHGIAHPRRFGLASHLGVLYNLPMIGCAKRRLIGRARDPGPRKGDGAELIDGGQVVGAVLRTREGVKPVYVSTGHRISLRTACEWVLRLCRKCRLPEPIRAANQVVNQMKGRCGSTLIP